MQVVLHNSVSLDGSLTGFMPDMEIHYQLAGSFKADANLVGSNTIISGIELFGESIPAEEALDFEKPIRDKSLPYWVIPDTKGKLQGMLHTCRRFEFCRDVIVLVSESTSDKYLRHLDERNYDYLVCGSVNINFTKAFTLLTEKYQISTLLTDTGQILGSILLNQGLIDKISILIHPLIVGKGCYPMFASIGNQVSLSLIQSETHGKGLQWQVYEVIK